MLLVLALVCLVIMLAAMAVVAVSVNEFSKKMEEFHQILETRYSLEAALPVKPILKKVAEVEAVSPLEALLKKTQESLTKKT